MDHKQSELQRNQVDNTGAAISGVSGFTSGGINIPRPHRRLMEMPLGREFRQQYSHQTDFDRYQRFRLRRQRAEQPREYRYRWFRESVSAIPPQELSVLS